MHRTTLVSLLCQACLAGLAAAQTPALRGLDPVALCRGVEQPGDASLTATFEDFTYVFATSEHRATFAADPARYGIQFGGGCGRMGPLSGRGSPDRFLVHDGRIYVFASDACQRTFAQRPAAFLDADVPRPEPDTAAAQQGQLLLQRAIAAHGGAERLRALTSCCFDRAVEHADGREEIRLQLRWPDGLREDMTYRTKARDYVYANVLGPDGGHFVGSSGVRPMPASGQRELRRRLLREPLVALRAALDGDAVAAARPTPTGGAATATFVLWIDGCATTFGVDADGRVCSAAFRGRGPSLAFGDIELTFADFVEHGGVVVPQQVRGSVDGTESAALAQARTAIAIDRELPASTFLPPAK